MTKNTIFKKKKGWNKATQYDLRDIQKVSTVALYDQDFKKKILHDLQPVFNCDLKVDLYAVRSSSWYEGLFNLQKSQQEHAIDLKDCIKVVNYYYEYGKNVVPCFKLPYSATLFFSYVKKGKSFQIGVVPYDKKASFKMPNSKYVEQIKGKFYYCKKQHVLCLEPKRFEECLACTFKWCHFCCSWQDYQSLCPFCGFNFYDKKIFSVSNAIIWKQNKSVKKIAHSMYM